MLNASVLELRPRPGRLNSRPKNIQPTTFESYLLCAFNFIFFLVELFFDETLQDEVGGGGVICFILSCICALRGQSFGCCMMGVCKWRAFILLGHNTSKSQSATHGGSGARAAA